MAYIRVKKINGRDYAYLVESIKTFDGPRQKVKQYLGKVVELEKKDNFREDNSVDDNSIDEGFVADNLVFSSPRELVLSLAEKELKKHGFELKKNKLCHDRLVFDPNNFNLRNDKNA